MLKFVLSYFIIMVKHEDKRQRFIQTAASLFRLDLLSYNARVRISVISSGVNLMQLPFMLLETADFS